MKLKCYHGHYRFFETDVGEISDLMRRTGLTLVPVDDYFTFEEMASAPKYSLAGKNLINIPAVKTFEGEPWEVFEANEFVFDFTKGLVVPIASVTIETVISAAGNRYVVSGGGLLLAGSFTQYGQVRDFSAWYNSDRLSWLYSEVTYV